MSRKSQFFLSTIYAVSYTHLNIGIERTFQKMEEAKIVIWLLDEQPSASEIEEMKLKNQCKKLLVVFNKMDKFENDKLAFDKFTHSCGSDVYKRQSL